MKSSLLLSSIGNKMNTQDVGFSIGDPESPTEVRSSFNPFSHRAHSRSSSWSFTGSTRPGASDLGSSLASINPIRSVIREFVPSLDPTRESPVSPPSRSGSQLSMRLLNRRDDDTIPNYITQSRGDTPPNAVNSSNSLSSEDSNIRDQPFADNTPMTGGGGIGNVDIDAGGVELSEGLRWVEQNAFFFTILLIRYAWMHKSGLLVIVAMFATYLHCNYTIRRQVSLKNHRQKLVLSLILLFLCGNISFVYYAFREEKLYNCLIFMTPMLFLDLWNLVWCICLTDFVVRFVTMAIKCMVSLCFLRLLPSRKKGKYYMLVEYLSQFYRSLIPTPLWFGYFSNYYDTGAVFAVIVTALYLMIKGAVILSKGKELIRAVLNFARDKSYGVSLRRDELVENGESMCPICQEEYCGPIKLRCQHVFCEECVLQWFDRERTCPLCRANIGNDPKWRDGSTSAWPQVF